MHTDALLDVIRQGIAERGFYLLADGRLELICGEAWTETKDISRHGQGINAFAKRHNLRAEIREKTVLFYPDGATKESRRRPVRRWANRSS